MFYYKLFIGLMTIITTGLANPVSDNLAYIPKHCCVSKQFSSKTNSSMHISLPDGTSSTTNMLVDYAYDEQRGLIGVRGIATGILDDEQHSFWSIHDFKNEIMYTISSSQENYCLKNVHESIHKEMICVQDTATYSSSSNYEYNGKQIPSNTWVTDLDGMISYETFSQDKCIPLKSEFYSEDSSISGSAITINFAESIVDPSIIDIPVECHY